MKRKMEKRSRMRREESKIQNEEMERRKRMGEWRSRTDERRKKGLGGKERERDKIEGKTRGNK